MARSSKKRTVTGVNNPGTLHLTTRLANLGRHDLGDVTPMALIKEADFAALALTDAMKSYAKKDYTKAMDLFFKAAAIACNVTFTARSHDTPIPEKVIEQMVFVSERATGGIKKVMMALAISKVRKHERAMHPRGTNKVSRTAVIRAISEMS